MSTFSAYPAIRIVSLPVELENTYDVSSFVSTELGVGEATWINIVNMTTDRGVKFRTAFVDISGPPIASDFMFPSNGRFHFNNGKTMDYLKIIACKSNKPSVDPLVLMDGAWSSIYLPVIAGDLSLDNGDLQIKDKDSFTEFFEDFLKIGQVSSIDFINNPDSSRSAFVHFDFWYDNHTARLVRKTIESNGQFVSKGYYDGFDFSSFDNRRFLVMKRDTKGEPASCDVQDPIETQVDVADIVNENSKLKAMLEKFAPLTSRKF
jgi:hypothetical protein